MLRRILALSLVALAAGAAWALAADDAGPERLGDVYVEAEQQLPALEGFAGTAAATDAQSIARRQGNCCGVVWSSNAQVLFENRAAPNRFTLRFDVPADGEYRVAAVLTRGPDYGVAELSVDGRRAGPPVDLHAASVARADPVDLGRIALARGRHTVTVAVVGKNAASGGYNAGLDFLWLRTG